MGGGGCTLIACAARAKRIKLLALVLSISANCSAAFARESTCANSGVGGKARRNALTLQNCLERAGGPLLVLITLEYSPRRRCWCASMLRTTLLAGSKWKALCSISSASALHWGGSEEAVSCLPEPHELSGRRGGVLEGGEGEQDPQTGRGTERREGQRGRGGADTG